MIRGFLTTVYSRTLGAAKNWFFGLLGSGTKSGLLLGLYVVVIVGLMAGFIDAIVFPVPNQGQIIYPSPGAQTIPEAIIDALVIVLGGAGIYFTYISGRQTTRARAVNLYLSLALLLIAVSILAGVQVQIIK